MGRLIKLTKETWQVIKLNIKNILIFEFVYRLVIGSIYMEMLNRAVRFSLKMAGYSYLTAGNIGFFLIKPWTVICIVIIGIAGLLLLAVEAGALITAFQGAAYFSKLNPLEMLAGGTVKLLDEVKRKNYKLLLVILVHYFLMNLYLIYRILTHIKPLNFMMAGLFTDPFGRLAAVLVIVLFVMIAVPNIFVFHGCMIEQKSFLDSLRRSIELLKQQFTRSLVLIGGFNILLSAGFILLYILSVCLAAIFVVEFTDKNLAFAVLLVARDRIEMVLIFLSGIAVVVVNIAAVTVQYYQYAYGQNHKERWNFDYPKSRIFEKKAVLGIVCTISCLSLFFIFDTVQNGSSLASDVLLEIPITAHRGSSKSAPENTLSALELAVEELADYAEIDVQMTSDGIVVLNHDNTLKRVAGINSSVASMTYGEVAQAEVGSWFSVSFFGEKIPTLEQAMELCKGRIKLNIEIKNVGKNSLLPDKVLELVEIYEMQEQCVITSTNLSYLQRIKDINPDIRTGYIISAAYGNYYSNDAIDFISIRSAFVNEKLVSAAHEQGKAIHAWTVNSKSEMERMKFLGADNIITDYPVLAREIIYREGTTETLLEYLRLVLK